MENAMTVRYEWDVELVNKDSDDIIDHNHFDKYADAVKAAALPTEERDFNRIVLVRDDDDGRSWAYVKNGKLPKEFRDAYCMRLAEVPKRFHAEVAKS
jgi:hypothetical protein